MGLKDCEIYEILKVLMILRGFLMRLRGCEGVLLMGCLKGLRERK